MIRYRAFINISLLVLASAGAAQAAPAKGIAAAHPFAPSYSLQPSILPPALWKPKSFAQNATPGYMLEDSAARLHVYVANFNDSSISVFPDALNNPKPIGRITASISSPEGISVDRGGNLYVANTGNNTVAVFKPGALRPFRIYRTGISSPSDVAVDHQGTVYVSNLNPPSVIEFARGSMKPTARITDVQFPVGLALDKAQNLYVANVISPGNGGPSNVLVYPPDWVEGKDFGIRLQFAGGLMIEPASQDLYIVDQSSKCVEGFPTIGGAHTRGFQPNDDYCGNGWAPTWPWYITTTPQVIVSSYQENEIIDFTVGSMRQDGFINQGLNGPMGGTLSVMTN